MDKVFKIAVVLSAYDKMTTVISKATSESKKKLKELQDQAKKTFTKGGVLFGAGLATSGILGNAINAFAELEESQNKLKSTMMGAGGILDENKFKRVNDLAVELGNQLKGNSADFFNMMNKQMQLGVSAESILSGVGRSTAYLAIATNDTYENAAETSAKLKYATGIADEEMKKFLDTISRTYNLGVNTGEMSMAFSRSAGSLKTLGLQGLEASNKIAPLYALLSKTGISGERIGTNMSAVFNQMMDTGKMGKFNNALKEFGISAEFVDQKSGQFLGVDNMMKQLDKLRVLNPQQLANTIKAWLGPGADTAFIEIFTNAGSKGYDAMVKQMANQATLDQKVAQANAGWNLQMEALTGTWTNVKAAIGQSLMPVLKPLLTMLNDLATKTKEFIDNHPILFQFISTLTAIAAAGMMLAGVIKIIQGIIVVMRILNITMLVNPFVLFAAIAIAVVALIIAHWDEVTNFFENMWDDIKTYWNNFWDWAAEMVAEYGPEALIYKAWNGITDFFGNIWEKVKAIFKNGWNAVKSFFGFGDSDADKVASNYEKSLNDINKKTTAAIGFNANSNVNLSGGASPFAVGLRPSPIASSNSINYAPVINYSGPGGAQDAAALTGMMKTNFDKQMQEHQAQQKRRAF